MSPPAPRRSDRYVLISLVGAILLLAAAVVGPGLLSYGHGGRTYRPDTGLRTIVAAQEEFHRGGLGGVRQYWRDDIAGLYTVIPPGAQRRIGLIELSIACADDRPGPGLAEVGARQARGGWWYRSIRHEGETAPDPHRFAVCAYPDTSDAGKWTYIVSEENHLFRKALGRQRGVDVFPKDPATDGWEEFD